MLKFSLLPTGMYHDLDDPKAQTEIKFYFFYNNGQTVKSDYNQNIRQLIKVSFTASTADNKDHLNLTGKLFEPV